MSAAQRNRSALRSESNIYSERLPQLAEMTTYCDRVLGPRFRGLRAGLANARTTSRVLKDNASGVDTIDEIEALEAVRDMPPPPESEGDDVIAIVSLVRDILVRVDNLLQDRAAAAGGNVRAFAAVLGTWEYSSGSYTLTERNGHLLYVQDQSKGELEKAGENTWQGEVYHQDGELAGLIRIARVAKGLQSNFQPKGLQSWGPSIIATRKLDSSLRAAPSVDIGPQASDALLQQVQRDVTLQMSEAMGRLEMQVKEQLSAYSDTQLRAQQDFQEQLRTTLQAVQKEAPPQERPGQRQETQRNDADVLEKEVTLERPIYALSPEDKKALAERSQQNKASWKSQSARVAALISSRRGSRDGSTVQSLGSPVSASNLAI